MHDPGAHHVSGNLQAKIVIRDADVRKVESVEPFGNSIVDEASDTETQPKSGARQPLKVSSLSDSHIRYD